MRVPARPHAQLPPRRLGKDDAGVVQVHGGGVSPRARGTPVPDGRAQGELQTRGGGGGGRGRGQDRTVDGPGGGGDVYRVVRLPPLGLVGGEEAERRERPRVVGAGVGGGEAEEGQSHLRVRRQRRLLRGTSRTGLTLGGLRGGARGLGGALRGGGGLRRVRRSLPTIRLSIQKTKDKKKILHI